MITPIPGTQQKALALNLDARSYGSIAEIGGGQEVARWFFKVGGAAGTVAKTISAYDMAVSDGLYGPTKPYVSRKRLQSMLEHEFEMVSSQLAEKFGGNKCFFAFANTVATRRFHSAEHGHGWIGIRFQRHPREEPSQISLHAHLLDIQADREQEALGILGVNLIYGAFFHDKADDVVASLMDELSRERIEIDMIKFAGPAFEGVDNRLMSLQLVEKGFTDAVMITAAGEVVQPSEVLYKKPILIGRGSYRPVTKLTLDLLEQSRDAFLKQPGVEGQQPVILAEMTFRNLTAADSEAGHADFLARAEILGTLGFDVLITRFELNYQVAEYLAAYTDKPIGFAIGLPMVRKFVEEKYYADLAGGVLEGFGRLFKRSVKIYVYPALDPRTGKIDTIDDVRLPDPWQHLHQLLSGLGRVEGIQPSDDTLLAIDSEDVLSRITDGDASWEPLVPAKAAEIIKSKQLFGEKVAQIVAADHS